MSIADTSVHSSEDHDKYHLLLTDFRDGGTDFGWFVVNDNVMGGRSDGGFGIDEDALRFTGHTNTEGGGFSSIRTAPVQLDLSTYSGIRLRVKGDGRRYNWRLSTGAQWHGQAIAYWAEFETARGAWRDVDIPFSDFAPQYRGYRLDGPALDVSGIKGMGLMIYDGKDGPFELHLDRVSAYVADEPFSLSKYRWERRVLVLSARDEDDEDLKRQLEELATSAGESADRDLTVVTLLDEGDSRVDGRTIDPVDAAAIRRVMEITPGAFALRLVGKDGSVKLARAEFTRMQAIYLLIDSMPMRARETAARPE